MPGANTNSSNHQAKHRCQQKKHRHNYGRQRNEHCCLTMWWVFHYICARGLSSVFRCANIKYTTICKAPLIGFSFFLRNSNPFVWQQLFSFSRWSWISTLIYKQERTSWFVIFKYINKVISQSFWVNAHKGQEKIFNHVKKLYVWMYSLFINTILVTII